MARKEFEFAEVLVDRLFLESFSNENSAYYKAGEESPGKARLDSFHSRLQWHINHSLSARQKQVIKAFLNGKKERQIADELGIKQQVVNIYKHRAINKLGKLLIS
ncbi:MAG: LuxR C-terminal-related transcriptional regulator [candidate division Zixibacteria bacterium]|nr:LuxR C-terminal-related transcriptional regulator [candidate division Zixibacteria bacterium]